MFLETERLIMFPCNNKNVEDYSYDMVPHILEHLAKLTQDPSYDGWGPWLVIEKMSNLAIGDMGFKGRPSAASTVEIGYGIAPAFQNKGYATEAVSKLLEWAFSQNVAIVSAECLQDNLPSIRVLEKLGMKQVEQQGSMLYWQKMS